jgi:hypothetical protein
MRRWLLWSLLALLALYVFRRAIYRSLFHYEVLYERAVKDLSEQPPVAVQGPADLETCIAASLSHTAGVLRFSASHAPADPERLVNGGEANCIGYAALFSALCRQCLEGSGLEGVYQVQHHVAHLHFLGFNVHRWSPSSFWNDHDIVGIRHTFNGEVLWVDPTLFDLTGIRRVRVLH